MRRRLAVVTSAALLVACNVLTGVGELGVEGANGSSGGPSRSDGGGGSGDGSSGGGGDGSNDDGGAVTPSLAACGESALCIPNSNGWAPAIYQVFAFGTACPSEWPQEQRYQKAGGGGCACRCTSNGAACAGPLDVRTGAACAGQPSSLSVPGDGSCFNPGAALPSPVSLTASGAPPPSCGAQVIEQLGGPEEAVTCVGATVMPSSSCGAGEVCVPKPSSPAGIPVPTAVVCMMHEGELACPKNLPYRQVVGSSVTDGRSCGATCACAPSDCNAGKLEGFSNAACTASVRVFDVNGKCNVAAAPTATYFKYTAATGCAVTQPPQELGTQTVQAPRTFCCSNPSPF